MAEEWLESAALAMRDTEKQQEATPAEDKWLGDAAQNIIREHDSRRSTALTSAAAKDPAQMAQLRQNAKQVGLPVDIAKRDPAVIPPLQAAKTAQQLASQDDTPATRHAFENPDFADIAHDRVEPLSLLERNINALKKGTANLATTGEYIGFKVNQLLESIGSGLMPKPRGMSEEEWHWSQTRAKEATRTGGLNIAAKASASIPRDPYQEEIARRIDEQEGTLGGIWEGTKYLATHPSIFTTLFTEQVPSLAVFGPVGGVSGQAVTRAAAPAIQRTITSQAVRKAIEKGAPLAATQFTSNTGMAFGAELTEGLTSGLTVSEAETRAGTKALVEGGINALSAFLPIPEGTTRLQRVGSAVAEAEKQGLFGAAGAAGAAAAVDEEITLSELFLEHWGEFATAPVDLAIVALTDPAATEAKQREAAQLVNDAAKAQEAIAVASQMEALGALAQEEELAKRDPEAFEEFVNQVAGEDSDEVFIEAAKFKDVLEQSGLDPSEVLNELPSVANQYANALATGGDIRMPMGEYVTKIATTEYHQPLSQHVRLRPEGMSPAEAQTWQETAISEFEQRSREEDPLAEEKVITPARQVYEKMLAELTAVEQPNGPTTGVFGRKGKLSKKTAEGYARLHQAVAGALASRGVDPMKYYGGLFVQGEPPAAGVPQFDEALRQDLPVPTAAAVDPAEAWAEHHAAQAAAQGLTPEQAAAVAPAPDTDALTGLFTDEELLSAIDRAQASGEAHTYVESDTFNLGGMNKALGANVRTDAVLKQIAEVYDQAFQGAVVFRRGAGRFAAIVPGGYDTESALAQVDSEVARVIEEQGLTDIPAPKVAGAQGVALYSGVSDIPAGATVDEVIRPAQEQINAAMPQGVEDVDREQAFQAWVTPPTGEARGVARRAAEDRAARERGLAGVEGAPGAAALELAGRQPGVVISEGERAFATPARVRRAEFETAAEAAGLTVGQAEPFRPVTHTDPLTGWFTDRDRVPTIARAQQYVEETGAPAVYVVADISNLGGLNLAMGEELADVVFRNMAQIVGEQAAKVPGGESVPFRHGGDEISFVITGADPAAVQAAMDQAASEVAGYVEAIGLQDLPHAKDPTDPARAGTGVYIGLQEIVGTDMDIDADIVDVADAGVELRKMDPKAEPIAVELQEGDPLQADLYQSGPVDTESEAFQRWAGGADVPVVEDWRINDYDFTGEGPFVVKVFHGTTHEFDEFDATRGNFEGQFGAVNYFTSSEQDATDNYAGEGPDLTIRIEQRAEQVQSEIEDDPEAFGLDPDDFDAEEKAKEIARKELAGGKDPALELYVRMDNPFIVGGETQWLEFVDDQEVRDLAIDRVAEDEGIEPDEVRENEEDYEDAIDEARWEIEADSEHPLAEAIRVVTDRNDIDASELASQVYELGGEATSDSIEQMMRESEAMMYAKGPEGALVGQHLIGEVIQELGYDAIILKNADQRFENMEIESGTAHVHVFHANRTNIKSVQNAGTFDPATGNIYAQPSPAAPRGKIAFGPDITDGQTIISLLEGADLSTFLHESGHFLFEVWRDLASDPNADPSFREDMQALLDHVGVATLDEWNAMTMEERREGHETVARSFEAYLFEGKAPTPARRKLFDTFAAWLRKVYASLKSLNVELSDDVRAVFDRMVASEEQIQLAERNQEVRPMFTTAEEAGMTAEEFAEYQALALESHEDAVRQLQARSLRDMKWVSGAKNRKLKELQKRADAERKRTRAEVEAEVSAEPVYQALRFFKRGETVDPDGNVQTTDDVHRLDIDAVESLYREAEDVPPWQTLGYGAYGILGREGLHPDMAAEWFGFSSGDELVRALLEARPYDEVVDGITDQRMVEENADLSDAKAIEAAANEAIHNEVRQRMVATELSAISKLAAIRSIDRKQAKEYAEAAIAKLRVRDVTPGQFAVVERRAGRAAQDALARGETLVAARAKQEQYLNGQLTKEAHRGQEEIEKTLDYFKKLDKKGVRKNIDPSYLEQIDQILSRFDLRKGVSLKAIDKRTSLTDWVAKQEEMGLTPVIDERLLNEAQREHYKNLPLEDLRELRDSIKNIEHLGRLKKKLLTARDEREFAEIVDSIETSIRDNATRTIERSIETRTPAEDDKEFLGSWFAAHRKLGSYAREMDGSKDGGVLWEYFIRPMNERGDMEAVEREAATKRFSELFSQYFSLRESFKQTATNLTRGRFEAAKPEMMVKTHIPEIGMSLSKMGRLVVALNWGNAGNRERIQTSYGWTEAQAQAILNTLDEQDWAFVQGVWDFIGEYWPRIRDKEQRVTGLAPESVEALPFQTPFGEMKGGYYPIKYDHRQSPKTTAHIAEDAAKQALKGAFTRSTTRRGHTKERTGNVDQKVRLDFGVMFEHVDQVVHDLAWHEWLVDANRLLGNKKIQAALYDHYGPATYSTMKKAIEDIAAGDTPAELAFERSINWLRTGTSIAGMGWSLWTSLLQPFGLTQGMARIGTKWVGRGLAKWMGNAARMEKTVASIHERSDFMRLRAKTMQREINEIQNKVMAGGVMTAVQDSYFYLIVKAQQVADVPIWLGQYEKMVSEGRTEADAIALADQAVLDSQGGGQVKDLAQIQRGGPLLKLWTNFYSYFNTTYNLTAESYRRTEFTNPKHVGRFAVDMLLLYWLPATMSALMREALKGGCSEGDEACVMESVARENLSYMAGTMIGMREFSGFLNGFYGYSGPAGTRFFSESTKLMGQVSQGEVDEALLKALNNTAGVLFHYPSAQVQRTADGFVALADGDTDSPLAPVFGPPRD